MRLVRLGEEPTAVGADVRAALAAWGPGGLVLGGVALLGCRPPGCVIAVDAVVVLPQGVLVVVGVDLPDPAMRLEAPLDAQWSTDGWPLVRPDRAVNPTAEALAATSAVAAHLRTRRTRRSTGTDPLPVTTVIAVGPYVAHVVQPATDLARGVRVLHPEPTTLLAAARELATAERPCSVDRARSLLSVLAPEAKAAELNNATLTEEGFPDAVTAEVASARTMLLPKIATPLSGPHDADRQIQPKWLPFAAAGLVGMLLLAGVVAALRSGEGGPPARTSTVAGPVITADGMVARQRNAARDTDCAHHSFGDVAVWLGQHPCAGLSRTLLESTSGDRQVALAVAEVTFPDEDTAQQFQQITNTPGTGGVNDLVREGRSWPGGPASFDSAAYASSQQGSSVELVQAVWIGGPSTADDSVLRTMAEIGLRLPPPR